MPEVFVGAGSNFGPERALRRAGAELERRFGAVRYSRVYRSAAVGASAAPLGSPRADYLNLVVAFSTDRDADSVHDELRAIETLAGRTRIDRAVCELDLDLLLYGASVDAARRLPRPGLFTAPFILGPLAELAPTLVHPVTAERCGVAWQAAKHDALRDVGPFSALR
ncbi:MAG TPA: 2-amino-4-hydroxy-6-hydroxymethyldihydropteridine diphosphokinase [Gammaproteobacteria bacterium]|nr:2-amino-4-hydroxy-6-hydroxymethyldihydropteridine diphosphokinase [Gammaproteobacteria bacterium]